MPRSTEQRCCGGTLLVLGVLAPAFRRVAFQASCQPYDQKHYIKKSLDMLSEWYPEEPIGAHLEKLLDDIDRDWTRAALIAEAAASAIASGEAAEAAFQQMDTKLEEMATSEEAVAETAEIADAAEAAGGLGGAETAGEAAAAVFAPEVLVPIACRALIFLRTCGFKGIRKSAQVSCPSYTSLEMQSF